MIMDLHYTTNTFMTTKRNSKFHRFMDIRQNLFLPSGNFWVLLSHSSHSSIPPKFAEAKFYFKFFRDDNFS